jgi:hypothetical protein
MKRVLASASKRAIATNSNNTGNGYGKDYGCYGLWFVFVFWFVWRDHKKLGREKNCQ